jgi:type II secretory pathway pseudopilin PulG
MVVIVIIGILAAVAIPKLFGMSAKAKAQEVGPAAGTWVKMQMAYNMETSSWGDAEQISYKLPGAAKTGEDVKDESETSNFGYKLAITGVSTPPDPAKDKPIATWTATSAFTSDPCDKGSEWSAELGKNGDTPEMTIKKGTGATGTGTVAGCLSLTPSYYKIGCTNDTKNKAANDPVCAGAGEEK